MDMLDANVQPATRSWTPWIPPLLIACAILAASSFPYPKTTRSTGEVRLAYAILAYTVHFGQFFVFAVFTYRAWGSVPLAAWPALGLSLAATVLLSLTNELYQTLIPTRMASALDVGMDSLGGSVGLLLAHLGCFRWGWGRAEYSRQCSSTAERRPLQYDVG